jgi:transketolase
MKGQTAAMNVSEVSAPEAVDKPFGQALVQLARTRPEVVGLTADLGRYTDLDLFSQQFPERFFQIGMAEQNLIGVAAGLARTGYLPFATTYCVFAARRAYDFIAIDLAYSRANVKVMAGLPGITTGYGATHQGIEDVALMRAIPGLIVIDPCDATEIEQAVPAIADYAGPVYMRLLRGKVNRILNPDTYRFEIGKARRLRPGDDVLFISTGLMTGRALEAARALRGEGIEAGVLHVPTLKPFDSEAVAEAAARAACVVILENHSIIGGLASAVCEVLALSRIPARLERVGVPDRFLECGSTDYLAHKYGLSTARIVETARRLLENVHAVQP